MLTGMRRDAYVDAGLRSLRWLMARQTTPEGHFRPVGTASFGDTRKPRAFRSTAGGSSGDDCGLPDGWRTDGVRRLADRSSARLRMVSRQQRPVGAAGRSGDRQLPRRTAPRSRQSKIAAANWSSPISLACGNSPVPRAGQGPHHAALRSPWRQNGHLLHSEREHHVTSHLPEPAGAVSAARSRAGDRAPVQAGDRTARSQPDR